MLGILFLFVLASFVMFIGLLPRRSYRRVRTYREDMLHNQIQAAMNWSPEHFKLCKDGKWRNAYGQIGVCLSLEEFFAQRPTHPDASEEDKAMKCIDCGATTTGSARCPSCWDDRCKGG